MSVNLWGADITVRVSSAAPDAEPPVWNDISGYVIVPDGTKLETWLGRATELSTSEPGKFRFTLLNTDDRFTTGNPTSPYYPWWKQSRRVQIVETLGDKDYVLADGYLEIPQTVVQTQPVDPAAPKFITVTVTGVDPIARLRGGRKFKSALTEHIVYTGGTDLKGYWTLTEAAQPYNGVGPTSLPLTVRMARNGTTGLTTKSQPNTGLAPTGGEALGARMPLLGSGTSGKVYLQVVLPDDLAVPIGANDALVIVFWFAFTAQQATNDALSQDILLVSTPSISNLRLQRNVTTGACNLDASGGMTGSTGGGAIGLEALMPIGIYVKESTSVMELWIGGQRLTATLTGAPAGAGSLFWANLGFQIDYDLSHLQIYVGTNFGYTQYLEQIAQGYAPLDQQRTGARINTILNYAGWPQARRDIDAGASVMSPVTLLGKTAGAVLEEATTTERGRLFAQAGRIQFHDRIRVLNV